MGLDFLSIIFRTITGLTTSACISEASSQSLTDSTPESLHRSLYIAHSHLALHPPSTAEAISILQPHSSHASAKAVTAFANYLAGDEKEKRVEEVRDLVIECEGEGKEDEERVVRVIAGSMFVLEKEVEEAVATLTEGSAKTDLEW